MWKTERSSSLLSAAPIGTLGMGKASALCNELWAGHSLGPGDLTFRADKAPADVDVLVVAAAPAGSEVVGADDAVGGQDHGAGGQAEVVGVIRDRTPHAAHQATWHRQPHRQPLQDHHSFLL